MESQDDVLDYSISMALLPDGFCKKDQFLNKGIAYLFNDTIYEYDIHSANTSLMKYYGLADDSIIDDLIHLPKSKRVKRIGIMQKDKDFAKALSKAFANIRKEFFDANQLELNDIISVKKDAIFTRKQCSITIFENVEFIVKNQYSSFLQLPRLELYYGDGELDVKGIDDSKLGLHEDGIIAFLKDFFRRAESLEKADVLRFIRKYASLYKRRKLELSNYREFNADSMYTVIGSEDRFTEYWDDRIHELNIMYNWTNIIIPITLMVY